MTSSGPRSFLATVRSPPKACPACQATKFRSVLALVAALSPVDLDDQGLLNAMALFQGVTVLALLEVLKALTDHGVLLERAREVRVSPDVLADEVLITRAIMLGVDTGFVARVWQAFGTTHAAVIRNFAELDWLIRSTASREAATGFPDVFAGIWKDVSREAIAADCAGRSDALSRLAAVAGSQSSRVFSLVKEVLAAPTADCRRDWLFGQMRSSTPTFSALPLRCCRPAWQPARSCCQRSWTNSGYSRSSTRGRQTRTAIIRRGSSRILAASAILARCKEHR